MLLCVKVTIIADRWFGDCALLDLLENQLGFGYVIRVRGNHYVTHTQGERRKAKDWVGAGGRAKTLRDARVTDRNEYPVATVVCTKAKGKKEPWCLVASDPKATAKTLLHELTHAYHDQILSFNDPDILAAHKRAREGGKYPRNDRVVRSDHKEFFAGVTTRYFGTKEDREALAERDPILLKKLQKVWGKPKAYMDSPPPKDKTSPGKPRSGRAK